MASELLGFWPKNPTSNYVPNAFADACFKL